MSYYSKQRDINHAVSLVDDLISMIDVPERLAVERYDEEGIQSIRFVVNPEYKKMRELETKLSCLVEEQIEKIYDLEDSLKNKQDELDREVDRLQDIICDLESELAPLRVLMI